MVYDEGRIAKGVWSNGLLKVKVASDREQYEPYLLPNYSTGDSMCRKEDMMSLSREEAVDAVSKLHVTDCAFILRSNGTWSYAILKARSDGDDLSLTFEVNSKGSTKKIAMHQWGGRVRPPSKPDILPQYSVGEPGRDEDMIICSREETVRSASKLRVGDAVFVR